MVIIDKLLASKGLVGVNLQPDEPYPRYPGGLLSVPAIQ
jgi:hypothetical protein